MSSTVVLSVLAVHDAAALEEAANAAGAGHVLRDKIATAMWDTYVQAGHNL
jgi:hypothetical protein